MQYSLPVVARIETEHGGHIEPPLESSWSNGRKLAWLAAIVKMDTGLYIEVRDGGLSKKVGDEWVKVPNTFSFTIGGASIGPFAYDQAWCYLTGVSTGARQAARLTP